MNMGQHTGKCEFEVSPHICELTGRMEATLFEVGGYPPTGIIRTDQEWGVRVNWCIEGHLIHHLCGEFCICVYIECIGAGPEKTLKCVRVPFDPCGNGCYSVDITIPAGAIDAGACQDCGQVCCLAVTLTSFDPCQKSGHIAAFCKGPCVMFTLPAHSN